MTREEMLDRMRERNHDNQELLGLMKEKWQDVVRFLTDECRYKVLTTAQREQLLELDEGAYNCALCETYYYAEEERLRCKGCIVFNMKWVKRKRRCCVLTPVFNWTRYLTWTHKWQRKTLITRAEAVLAFLERISL